MESNEPLVQIPENNKRLLLDKTVNLGYKNDFIARAKVIQMLEEALKVLPKDMGFLVKEAYRPLSFQKFIFQRRVNNLLNKPENGHLSLHHVHKLAAQFVAPPEVAGHPTGGAIDITLVNESGIELDLGCDYDDDELESEGRCFSKAENLSSQALKNRKILFESLGSVGFVNYPYEWWHWSFGDKY